MHVRQPGSAHQPDESPASIDITTRIAQQLDQLQHGGQNDTRKVIQAGEVDEANS
jgi:hypothetical protein